MKKPEDNSLKNALYFWGSLLGVTILLILDTVTGFGVTSAFIKLFFPEKV
jgi:hypothetical protein